MSRHVRCQAAIRASILVDVTYAAVVAHVYSGPDSYSAGSRTLGPFRPDPALGSVTVQVGRAPRWLFRARQRLYALDLVRGGNLLGWLEGSPDPRFRLRPNELDRPWYTTLTMELPPVRFDIAELDKAMEVELNLREAAVLLAADSTANAIAKPELRGLFLQRSDGKWVKFPDFELFPPTVGIGQSEPVLQADVTAASATLGSWRASDTGTRRIDWALKALLTEEPWSQFVWLMFSLEQLVKEHDRLSRGGVDRSWRSNAEAFVQSVNPSDSLNWRSPSVTLRFARLAAHLSPDSGATDTAAFFALKQERDRMLHGAQSQAPEGAARQAARDLTLRYNKVFTLHTSTAGFARTQTPG